MYKSIVSDFSLIYLEDPFGEDDLDGWKKLFADVGSKVLIVGDDLISTNPFRLQNAVSGKTVGGVIIKPNQIGTVTEAIAVVEIAKYTRLKVVVSHRSGETEDSFIADFAVGVGADYLKFGAPARERNVKYNRLLAIDAEIASK
jgi:enolase